MTILELHEAYVTRRLSPVEVLGERLNALDAWQARTRLFVSVDADRALEEARASEARYRKGEPLSQLDGILVGLKDLIDAAGEVTTAGSGLRLGAVATKDAPVVERLRTRGANLRLGKLNLHEFAYGPTGASSYFGAVGNPYDPTRMSGGSSSGSAVAVASGLMSAALGTDTGGSVRIPSAWCGISGLKPTYGAVSRTGVVPLSWSLDHVGPMARTVADVRILFEAMAGRPREGSLSGRKARLFWPDNTACYEPGLEEHVSRAIEAVAQSLSAEVSRGPLPELENIWLAQTIIIGSEALSYHWTDLEARRDQYQPDVAERLAAGGAHLAVEYLAALRFRQAVAARYDEWLKEYDAIILPAVPIAPPSLSAVTVPAPSGAAEDVRAVATRYTNPFNLLGLPALSIPWGLHNGFPVGLQLVGRRDGDGQLLNLGEAIQERFPDSIPTPPAAAV